MDLFTAMLPNPSLAFFSGRGAVILTRAMNSARLTVQGVRDLTVDARA